MESLLLFRRALASPTMCRFIPALSVLNLPNLQVTPESPATRKLPQNRCNVRVDDHSPGTQKILLLVRVVALSQVSPQGCLPHLGVTGTSFARNSRVSR